MIHAREREKERERECAGRDWKDLGASRRTLLRAENDVCHFVLARSRVFSFQRLLDAAGLKHTVLCGNS